MIVGIVRIVLPGIVFADDRIDCKVQKKAAVFPKNLISDLREMSSGNNLFQNQICTDFQAAASVSRLFLLRSFRFREESEKVLVWNHQSGIRIFYLTYARIAGNGIFLNRIIFPAVRIVNIGCSTDRFLTDSAM